jgi:CheY-like chemotaxis protein
MMSSDEKVNILLVDDQPAKLLSYEVILREIGENLIQASSGGAALEHLLRTDIAVVLMDVCMPELDGFELAAMIRNHPRFRKTAIIFVSAIHLTDVDRLRAYEIGAVDYVPVPVVPEVLRAKVRVFAELNRKSRQLERLIVGLGPRRGRLCLGRGAEADIRCGCRVLQRNPCKRSESGSPRRLETTAPDTSAGPKGCRLLSG